MKPGWGAGLCLADISAGLGKDTIRQRWTAGEYGKPGERPKGEYVAGWWNMIRGERN